MVGDGARGPNSTCPIDLARGGGLIRTGGGTILWGPRAPRPLSPKPPGAAGSANGESAIENGASAVENCENAVENGANALANGQNALANGESAVENGEKTQLQLFCRKPSVVR